MGYRNIEIVDRMLSESSLADEQKLNLMIVKTILLNYENQPDRAYETLELCRLWLAEKPALARDNLYTMIYFQGITALRRGETDNCVMCRGESSCILPISNAAIHTRPTGSRLAITHFTEYLERVPRRPRGSLAPERGAHDARRVSRTRSIPSIVFSLDHFLEIRVRHRQVPRHRPPCRRKPLQQGRRRDHGRLRQ